MWLIGDVVGAGTLLADVTDGTGVLLADAGSATALTRARAMPAAHVIGRLARTSITASCWSALRSTSALMAER